MQPPSKLSYEDQGIHCLNCGQWQVEPKRKADNWTCPYCFSGFISFQMLVNLISRELMQRILTSVATRDVKRPCPHCHHPLEKTELVDPTHRAHGIDLELCRACKLLWFEGGAIVKLVGVEGVKHIQPPPPPARGVRAPEIPATRARRAAVDPPWATLAIFASSSLATAISNASPSRVLELAFVPAAPLRNAGITWLTSLVLNHAERADDLLFFLAFGTFAERALGWRWFLAMYFAANIAGHGGAVYFDPRNVEPHFGLVAGALASAAYCLLYYPFQDTSVEKKRRKVTTDAISWGGIIGLLFFCSFVLGDLAVQVLSGATALDQLTLRIPFVGRVSARTFHTEYFMSALVGALFTLLKRSTEKARAAKT